MNWWGAAWTEKMQRLAEAGRFAEGERFALKGFVTQVTFDGRTIAARVQGLKEPLYTVRITFDPFSQEQWDALLSEVRDKSGVAASLAKGDMPMEIQTAYSRAKLRFMPERYADLHLECPCSDWLKPCKHLVAAWLRFGRDFDRDPYLLFELRGLKREELSALLLNRKAEAQKEAEEVVEYPEVVVTLQPEPLPSDPAAFWAAPMLPAPPQESQVRLLLDDDIFERLEDWQGIASQFHQIYDSVYELAGLLLS
jgi:uncharacterized Zn finger protein